MFDFDDINSENEISLKFFPTSRRKISIFIFCGIPGTGKSTYSKILQNKFVEGDCKIISRDELRGNILWELRKEEQEKQNEKIKKLDKLVSKKVYEGISSAIEENKFSGIIIDGCHTNWKTLAKLLQFVNKIENTIIHVLIVGNYVSETNWKISNKKEGDYSDYDDQFNHEKIPLEVLSRKRTEMRVLFSHYFQFMIPLIDYVSVLPRRNRSSLIQK